MIALHRLYTKAATCHTALRLFANHGCRLGQRNLGSFSRIVDAVQRNKTAASTFSVIKSAGQQSPRRDVPAHILRPSYVTHPQKPAGPQRGDTVEIKSAEQIVKLKDACRLAREVLNEASLYIKPGTTTDELDKVVHRKCIEAGAYPSPLMYKEFPKSVCTSVNNVACHGIPDYRPLYDGDIINVDVTVYYNGYHGDVSETYTVGNVNRRGLALIEAARECRDLAIAACGPGVPLCNIGKVIHHHARKRQTSVIPHFCGHGIGEYFHEPPEILHFPNYVDMEMQEGMAFTIEPIISETDTDDHVDIRILPDNWTALSKDDSRSAQFEHTVLITANGCEVLTR